MKSSHASLQRVPAKQIIERYQKGEREFCNLDLSGITLKGANLSGVNFSRTDIRGTDFTNCILTNARFNDSKAGRLSSYSAVSMFILTFLGFLGGGMLGDFGWLDFQFLKRSDTSSYLTIVFFVFYNLAILISLFRNYFIQTGIYLSLALLGALMAVLFTTSTINSFRISLSLFGLLITVIIASSVSLSIWLRGVFLERLSVLSGFICAQIVWHWFAWIRFNIIQLSIDIFIPLVSGGIGLLALYGIQQLQWFREILLTIFTIGGTRFRQSDLSNTDWANVALHGVNFQGAILFRTKFTKSKELTHARFDISSPLFSVSVQQIVSSEIDRSISNATSLDRVTMDGICLDGNVLSKLSLRNSSMQGCSFDECYLHNIDLTAANLSSSSMVKINLNQVNLSQSNLTNTILSGALLVDTQLSNAILDGANLTGVDLTKIQFNGARIDVATFKNSNWTMERLADLCEAGIKVSQWDKFPKSVREYVLGEDIGLTLYFDIRLTPFDRYIVDGAIIGILGQDTDCHVAKYEEDNEKAIVRLVASRRQDLERVAEALYRRVWEQLESSGKQLARLAEILQVNVIRDGLSSLMDQLREIVLREAIEPQVLNHSDREEKSSSRARQCWALQTLPKSRLLFGTSIQEPIRLFVGYAREDEPLRQQFFVHLATLRNLGLIADWHEGDILPGELWSDIVEKHLNEADVIVLLISADFLASEQYLRIEKKCAEEQSGAAAAHVIPVLLRAVHWHGSSLAGLKVLPEGNKPITSWQNQDEAWANVAENIRDLVEQMRDQRVRQTPNNAAE